ncbi:MAG: HAD-IA family hydrolase, partial [Chloroflexi bacterium]|nr:HAD-IA family hydrolase [Chloroflexota bacterium]
PMLKKMVASAGLTSVFENVFSMHEVKIFKPSPKAYQLACDKLSLEPSEIGFVSGNSFDIVGATHFGFTTLWCNRTGAPLDELDAKPALDVSSLKELAAALAH